MKAWRVHRAGSPSEALRLDDIEVPEPPPAHVRVRAAATALNYNEVDGCRGRYLTVNPPMPYTLGMEVVGVVDAAGAGAEQWLGRRVVASAAGAFGAHAEQVIATAAMTYDAPPTLDDTHAAAFYFPFHLAYLGLHERGRLEAGETVLVHAGAGGVGSAAVQLGVAAGARVIATAGGKRKLDFCRELGASAAIDYRAGEFVDAVLEATDGRGVDVVFDGVGGDVAQQSLRCLGRNGRYLMVGFASGIEAEEVATITPRTICFGNFSICGVLLAYADDGAPRYRPGVNVVPRSVGERVHAHLLELLATGSIRPIIGSTASFTELPAALEAMEDRRTIGRSIVLMDALASSVPG